MDDVLVGLTSEDWRAVRLSVQVSLLAVTLSLPLGIAAGWFLAHRRFYGKTLVETVINLPLVLPPVVTGLLLLYVFGRRGLIGARLYDWFGIEIALTWRAVVVAVAVMGFPLLVRATRIAFQNCDPRLYWAARTLGAGPWRAFFTVSLPLARSGVISGAVLAFARGLGEFGATLMFAGITAETRTLPIQMYVLNNQPGDSAERQMWRLVIVSVCVACTALGLSEYLDSRSRRAEI